MEGDSGPEREFGSFDGNGAVHAHVRGARSAREPRNRQSHLHRVLLVSSAS